MVELKSSEHRVGLFQNSYYYPLTTIQMKKLYHLSIDAHISETMNNLRVHYEDKEKAFAELNKWKEYFRKYLSIPETSNDDWEIDDRGDNVWFRTSFKSNSKLRVLISLNIFEDLMMEEGEEIACLAGTVFRYIGFPYIYCVNKDPLVQGNNSISLIEPIDIEKRERCKHPEFAKEVEPVSLVEAEKYYIIRDELITGKKHA